MQQLAIRSVFPYTYFVKVTMGLGEYWHQEPKTDAYTTGSEMATQWMMKKTSKAERCLIR